MKIAVMGAGSMGSLFGGYLSKQNEVNLICRRKSHVDAINENGLVLVEKDGESRYRLPAMVDVTKAEVADIVILSVKAGQTREAVQQMMPIVGRDTFVMSVQNGYGNHLVLKEYINKDNIIIGTTSEAALYKEPGVILHTGRGKTSLGVISGGIKRIEPVVNELVTAGFDVCLSENVMELIWRKLFVNVGINALTAVHKVCNGAILENEKLKMESGVLVNEAVTVANSCGYNFDFAEIIKDVYEVAQKTAANRSSMLTDVDNKRKTEIDVINGAVVKMAKEKGLEAPHNAIITSIVRGMERSF